jgi:hypothetical protein
MTEQVRSIRLRPTASNILQAGSNQIGEIFYDETNGTLRVFTGAEVSKVLASKTYVDSKTYTNDDIAWIAYADLASLPSAADNHGMFAHVHATGGAYFAHAGVWIELALKTDVGNSTITNDDIAWIAYADLASLPAASDNHGMFAHVHSTGGAYFAHAGAWIRLADTTLIDGKADISSLAAVATSGSYTDLTDLPSAITSLTGDLTGSVFADDSTLMVDGVSGTIPVSVVSGLATVATSGAAADVGLGNVTNESKATMFTSPIFGGTVNTTNITSSTALTLSATSGVFLSGIRRTSEEVGLLTGATGTVVHDTALASVWYHTSIAANFTANFTNLPTTANRVFGLALMLVQGSTPYIPNVVLINGSSTTINWEDTAAPTGNASKVDVVTFAITRTGGAWTVIGSLSTYG